MFKKMISILIVVLMLVSLVGCGDNEVVDLSKHTLSSEKTELFPEDDQTKTEDAEKVSECTPLFYKVTDRDGDVVWLLGSIHVGDDSFYPLPDYILSAFDSADTLAVEVDVIAYQKKVAPTAILSKYLLPYGYTIKDYISEETYKQAKEILTENNMGIDLLDQYSPALWMQLIEELTYTKMDIDMEKGVDRHLIERAYDQDKKVADIEDADEHMDIYFTFSDELIEFLLEDAISSYKARIIYKEYIEEIMTLWKAGDEEELRVALSQGDTEGMGLTAEQLELLDEYNQILMSDRDKIMIDYVKTALDTDGEEFVCVGAAHVIGENGMVDQLISDGYTVEKVN